MGEGKRGGMSELVRVGEGKRGGMSELVSG